MLFISKEESSVATSMETFPAAWNIPGGMHVHVIHVIHILHVIIAPYHHTTIINIGDDSEAHFQNKKDEQIEIATGRSPQTLRQGCEAFLLPMADLAITPHLRG